ncbi:MAG: molecular chaperone TorD [Achromobacter sp.]|nr:molecular chaperone TorD [Achromobacter sp.]
MEHQLDNARIDLDWAAISHARSQIYGWFSTVFAKELGREAMALYLAGGVEPLLSVFSNLGLAREAEAVDGVLREWAQHGDALLENAADFAALFLLEGRHCPIPYASYYLGDGGLLYGKPAQLMRSFLASSQLRLDEQFKEPEDHLSVILALLSWWTKACDRAADITAQARDQAAFIESALTSWLAAWQARMDAVDGLAFRFYPAVGALLAAFVRVDLECLNTFR